MLETTKTSTVNSPNIMDGSIQAKIQELGDLELAILICLVAQEHCIFSTDADSSRQLHEELRLVCTSMFTLQPVFIECSSAMTVEEFSEGILVEPIDDDEDAMQQPDHYSRPKLSVDFTSARRRSPSRFGSNMLDNRRIADVVIAKNLDLASEHVQVQALELIRTKRIFTRRAMHTASKDFMMLAIASKPEGRLYHHLNDLFCISHFHAEEDDLQYLKGDISKEVMPNFSNEDIHDLRLLAEETRFTPELAAYLHNIVVFSRNNRYIKGGVTATASRQLRVIAKVLAPLHGLSYVPPSLIALAVRKLYPHRLKLTTVETERSLQWGSDLEAVKQLLEGVTVQDAIEDILASVETPL